jgi:outer membrane protein OmpA-like peptidoglycan-associated protein
VGALSTSAPRNWWSADALTGLADADPISTWTDNGYAAVSATSTSTLRPTYQTVESPTGLPITRWDGTDDSMSVLDDSMSATSVTIMAVIKLSGSGVRTIVGGSSSAGLQLRVESTGVLGLVKQATTFIASSTGAVNDGLYHVVAATISQAGTYAFYIDGAASGSGSHSVTIATGRNLRLGSHNAATEWFNGDIGVIARWDRFLSGTELSDIYAELNAEWIDPTIHGTVAATAGAPTVAIAGILPTMGMVAATAGAPTVSVAGTVVGATSGTVEATASAPTLLVSGAVPTPVTGTVTAVASSPTLTVTDSVISVAITGAGTITVDAVDVLDLVTLTDVTLTGGGTITVDDLIPVVPMTPIIIAGAGTIYARPQDTVGADPRTGGKQWRYVVTERDGTPLGELYDLEHEPVADGVNEPTTMAITVAIDDPARALIKDIERQCQVWEGDTLLLRGPILPGRAADDGSTITHQIHDPSWYWRGGRRLITRIPRLDLLRNGDFGQGLTYWTAGYDVDSIPAATPTVTIVDEDFANDTDDLDPIKAVQIVGVESVAQTKSTLDSAAVFYPNRPFSYEPLAAGFKPGGAAAVDAVATAMPATAGLKVKIVGHTANDGTGSGVALSLRRAQAAAARVAAIRPGAIITTQGVGFYDPDPAYPIDSAQQRRVVISYESTVTVSAKSKQWIRQTVLVTQPKAARYPLEITAAAMVKVADDWSVADANMVSLKVTARRQDTPTVVWDEASTSISDTDPVERWIGQSASVTIPADDRAYWVDVYLYAAAALTRFTMVGLFPGEALYFWGVDQALIVKGIAEHMQDTALGHGDLNIPTRTPLTGIKRDRSYSYRELMPVDTALDDFPSLNRGLDIDVLWTATDVTLASFYPRQGRLVDYALVQGDQIVRASPATTRDVASSVIAQAQSIGSYRAEAYARDESAFGGLLLERVITAEQETPLNELREVASAEVGWATVSTVAYWVDIDPARIAEVDANTAKGDTVTLVLDAPDQVAAPARIVKRQKHPDGLRLMLALEA